MSLGSSQYFLVVLAKYVLQLDIVLLVGVGLRLLFCEVSGKSFNYLFLSFEVILPSFQVLK